TPEVAEAEEAEPEIPPWLAEAPKAEAQVAETPEITKADEEKGRAPLETLAWLAGATATASALATGRAEADEAEEEAELEIPDWLAGLRGTEAQVAETPEVAEV